MRSSLVSLMAGTALAGIMAPAFAPPDSGDGSNTVTIDLGPVMRVVHEAESIETKTEAFLGGLVDKIRQLGQPQQPPVDTAAIQSQINSLADELEAKQSEFKAALSSAASATGSGPSISSLSPTSGSEAGGEQVKIIGKGFSDALAVNFGPQAAQSFNIVDDNTIAAITPPGTGGASVVVQGPLNLSNAVSFSYNAANTGGADTTQGGRGQDTTAGGAGSDTQPGGAGQDTTAGGAGADTTAASGGADTISAGGQTDTGDGIDPNKGPNGADANTAAEDLANSGRPTGGDDSGV